MTLINVIKWRHDNYGIIVTMACNNGLFNYLIEHSYFLEFSSVFQGLPFKFGDHFSNTCCLMDVLASIPCWVASSWHVRVN